MKTCLSPVVFINLSLNCKTFRIEITILKRSLLISIIVLLTRWQQIPTILSPRENYYTIYRFTEKNNKSRGVSSKCIHRPLYMYLFKYENTSTSTYINTNIYVCLFICLFVCSPFSRLFPNRLGYSLAQKCFLLLQMF